MEEELMNVRLSPHGMDLLRSARIRYPAMSAAEILEQALTESFGPERDLAVGQRSPEEVRAWLDELASLSEKIPPRPGETFSREMIYQDHP
jgi:hypothetical protein